MRETGQGLKRTPLYDMHVKYGGKMVDFGGWELPIQYSSGIINEHNTVRQKAGLFDVSHMGEITVKGSQALDFLQELVPNDVALLKDNQVQYTPMCKDDGGIIDDLIIYRKGEEDYLLVVNAANTERDFERVCEVSAGFSGAEVANISYDVAQIAIQGPLAPAILSKVSDKDIKSIKYFWFLPEVQVCGETSLVSRTGYTGEDGYEIYCSREAAPVIWEGLMQAGAEYGLSPAGLGARDTLRFEACLPLYGNELDEETNPLEAGLTRFIKLYKPAFRGKEPLVRAKHQGLTKKLVGLEVTGRGIPRHGYLVFNESTPVGKITSGSYAPTLDKNLGLAYVSEEFCELDTNLLIDVRGRKVEARVVSIPFYKREA